MPYISTDGTGNIISLHREPTPAAAETVAVDDPRLTEFLGTAAGANTDPGFHSLDLEFIRVIEDLVDVLISKNILLFTDLPPAAQDKILKRRAKREGLASGGILVDNFKLF